MLYRRTATENVLQYQPEDIKMSIAVDNAE